MKYRIYVPTKKQKTVRSVPTKTVNNKISKTVNNNIVNNFISQMNIFDVHKQCLEYLEIELVDFNDNIETQYKTQIERLENDNSKCHIEYKQDDIAEMVQNITKVQNSSDLNKYNVLYDDLSEKLNVYKDEEWVSYIFKSGVNSVIASLKVVCLDRYEIYMIKKIRNGNIMHNNTKFRQQLEDYYKFLICFDQKPYIDGTCDAYILDLDDSGDKSYDISETYIALFNELQAKMTKTEINSVRLEIQRIVKKMTKFNKKELSKNIACIIKMDEQFKQSLLL